MLVASSWIALHPIRHKRRRLYPRVMLSLAVGGLFTLAIVTQVVLELDPWYLPQFAIPIAGMIFANAMNTISLAAERFESEMKNGAGYTEARRDSLQAALIPITNMMFAVGLVSLPGMMTGQILSGVSPLIAVRYQIMVMCMMFGASGISAVCYLLLIKKDVLFDKDLTPRRGDAEDEK
jgi:putative ABC transport system permease protein